MTARKRCLDVDEVCGLLEGCGLGQRQAKRRSHQHISRKGKRKQDDGVPHTVKRVRRGASVPPVEALQPCCKKPRNVVTVRCVGDDQVALLVDPSYLRSLLRLPKRPLLSEHPTPPLLPLLRSVLGDSLLSCHVVQLPNSSSAVSINMKKAAFQTLLGELAGSLGCEGFDLTRGAADPHSAACKPVRIEVLDDDDAGEGGMDLEKVPEVIGRCPSCPPFNAPPQGVPLR